MDNALNLLMLLLCCNSLRSASCNSIFFCRIYFGKRPVLIVSDPDLLKDILIKKANSFIDRFVSSYAADLLLYKLEYLLNLYILCKNT